MAERPQVGAAGEEDVAYFAQRRCKSPQSRALYSYLAAVAPHVAVAKDVGVPIAIAIPHANEHEWLLSEWFVEESFRNSGTGTSILSEATHDAPNVARSGILNTTERAALRRFLHLGLAVESTLLQLSGEIPKEEVLAGLVAGEHRFTTDELDPARDGLALDALDREVRGTARPADHAYFSENGTGFAFRVGGGFAGYAYVWPDGRIGPLAAAAATYVAPFFAFALAALRRKFKASWCSAFVPGENIRVLRAAVRCGLVIRDLALFLSDAKERDFSRYMGFDRLLF